MTSVQQIAERDWSLQSEHNPFAEAAQEPEAHDATWESGDALGELGSPFAETIGVQENASDRLLAQAFAELRDEQFDEAVASLAEETEQAVYDRFTDESPQSSAERERYADTQLAPVRFEAQRYLGALEAGLAANALELLGEDQLGEVLDRLDPAPGELSPAGEEFIGSLVRKAKKAVKFVARTARNAGKLAGAALLAPVLRKLKALVNPLLKRVLAMAIGRLPAALQPAARSLASRIASESPDQEDEVYEGASSPATSTDPQSLAEHFDATLAEAILFEGASDFAAQEREAGQDEADEEGGELQRLAEARGALIDRLRAAGDEEDVAPVVEQFIPVLLGALRTGIKLVGRPKVVRFLAGYLGQQIKRWVGPTQSGPLANAIVDTGLRLVSLEAGDPASASLDEAAPVALASVVEDTVRRVAESEEFALENDDLLHLAASSAFGEAVASHFPQRLVRPGLRQAPSLGGAFVTRRPRSVRSYRKYSRTPDVELTAQIADALPTFGGTTVGAVLRAAGATFPIRTRMHIYQSTTGTTLPRMVRLDRASGRRSSSSQVHPLTPEAAGLLLREPGLGVAVAPAFLRSRHRIAAGQRFYLLEPVGAAGALALSGASGAASDRTAPSRAWIVVNPRASRITVGLYLSEADAQSAAEGVRKGRGSGALLQALVAAYKAGTRPSPSAPHGSLRIVHEDAQDQEHLAPAAPSPSTPQAAALRARIDAWVLPALAQWVRDNGEAFARAAAQPDPGVTLRIRLTAVPGLETLAQVAGGKPAAQAMQALRGAPAIAITVVSGHQRK